MSSPLGNRLATNSPTTSPSGIATNLIAILGTSAVYLTIYPSILKDLILKILVLRS